MIFIPKFRVAACMYRVDGNLNLRKQCEAFSNATLHKNQSSSDNSSALKVACPFLSTHRSCDGMKLMQNTNKLSLSKFWKTRTDRIFCEFFLTIEICPNIPLYELDDRKCNSADMTQSGKYGDFDRFCVHNNMSF